MPISSYPAVSSDSVMVFYYKEESMDNPHVVVVSESCDFVDLQSFACRYFEAGLEPGRYKDSICHFCLASLERLRNGELVLI